MSMTDKNEASEEHTWTPATEAEVSAAFDYVTKYMNDEFVHVLASELKHALGIVLIHYQEIEVYHNMYEGDGCKFCNLE